MRTNTRNARSTGAALSVVVAAVAALIAAVAPAAAAAPAAAPLHWGRCPSDIGAPELSCTTVQVPLDYRYPGGAHIGIAVSRLTSTGGHARRVLFTDPGGPGGAGLVTPHDLVTLGIPASVRATFDIIGFDPRGVGHSAPVTCNLSAAQQQSTIPPYARNAADVTRQAAAAKQVAQQCAASSTSSILPYITTANTARDMDRIRAALGQARISYFGESYGTYLGAVYTTLFPGHSDRIVLDSAVSPGGWDIAFQRRIARGFADRFPDFAGYAASHPAYGLGRTPAQVTRTYYALAGRLDRTPTEQGVTGALFRQFTFSNLYYDKDLPDLAAAWSRLVKGQPLPAAAAAAAVASSDNYLSSQLAVICNDTAWPRSVSTYQANVASDRTRYPMFGAATANVSPCAFWPSKPLEPPVTIGDTGPADVLIVQNERDPITPLAGAMLLRRAFGDRARIITADQGGHLAYLAQTNACLNDATTRYLVTGVRPARDLDCSA